MTAKTTTPLLPPSTGEVLIVDPRQGEVLVPPHLRSSVIAAALVGTPIAPDPRGEPLWVQGEVIPVTWTFPLGSGTLRLRIYPTENRILPDISSGCGCSSGAAAMDPCCSPLATPVCQ